MKVLYVATSMILILVLSSCCDCDDPDRIAELEDENNLLRAIIRQEEGVTEEDVNKVLSKEDIAKVLEIKKHRTGNILTYDNNDYVVSSNGSTRVFHRIQVDESSIGGNSDQWYWIAPTCYSEYEFDEVDLKLYYEVTKISNFSSGNKKYAILFNHSTSCRFHSEEYSLPRNYLRHCDEILE